MSKTQNKKKYFVFLVAIILILGVGFSGCTEDTGDENGGDELTGTAIYSGDWSGSTEEMGDIQGTWEFEVDFDAGTVSGTFTGDTTGDISGSVSDGVVDAEGDAAFGTVEWSGDFSSDGEDVSGEWEYLEGEGSGTWSGSFDSEVTENGDENGEDTTETYWNAFDFGEAVEEDGEEMGLLKEFTYEHTYSEDGSEKSFEIQTTYMGKTETEITVTKYDTSDYSETEETFNLNVHQLDHQIDILHDDENVDHPDSIEMTVYLPVEEYSTEEMDGAQLDFSNFWIYSKAEYTDSDGNEGMWSYYLTQNMKDEMEEKDNIYYVPYNEGDFNNYDAWVLYGIYGFGWMWFQPFTSDYNFQEGSMEVSTPEGSFSYNVVETTIQLSGHTFTAYEVTSSAVTFENNVELKGTFVPSLSVPVYLRVGDDSSSYEMELTDIVLE